MKVYKFQEILLIFTKYLTFYKPNWRLTWSPSKKWSSLRWFNTVWFRFFCFNNSITSPSYSICRRNRRSYRICRNCGRSSITKQIQIRTLAINRNKTFISNRTCNNISIRTDMNIFYIN